jgi:hypothetical protein
VSRSRNRAARQRTAISAASTRSRPFRANEASSASGLRGCATCVAVERILAAPVAAGPARESNGRGDRYGDQHTAVCTAHVP